MESAGFDFNDSSRADFFIRLARRIGFPLTAEHRILDFGCGRGQNVYHLRRKGLRAYGVDVDDRPEEGRAKCAELTSEDLFARAPLTPYRLPYADASFDFIFSDHVFEHVMDYESAMRELARVLAPGGVSLHIFPARLRLLESHLKVPLGGRVKNLGWFTFWASLGIGRAWHGPDLSRAAIGRHNYEWVASRVNYLTRSEIKQHARPHFSECHFMEKQAVQERLGAGVPGLGSLVGVFHIRVMVLSNRAGARGHLPAQPSRSPLPNLTN